MKSAPKPENESQRIADLRLFDILDSEDEQDYDDLVELVSLICKCPMAIITFIDNDRQWIKAKKNVVAREMSRDEAFCAHTILEKEVMLVRDTAKDERFVDNPLVTGPLKIGFYAGAPITSSNGYRLGSVCAIDSRPGDLDDMQIHALEKIARQVSRLLDLRQRNRQLSQTSTRLLEAERKIARINMRERELENSKTAQLLHEDIAQSTAAIKLYLNCAKSDPENGADYLQHGISEAEAVTKAITSLSRSIAPTTFENDNYAGHIGDLINEYRVRKNITVDFEVDPALEVKGETGLILYRITQELIRISTHSHSKHCRFSISQINGEIALTYDFTAGVSLPLIQRQMFESNILNRVEMLEGRGTLRESRSAVHVEINIPYN